MKQVISGEGAPPVTSNGILEGVDPGKEEAAPASETAIRTQAASIESTLQKDAYLVFRALCKLSIRSSDSSAGSDLTVLRGKVGPILSLAVKDCLTSSAVIRMDVL